MVNGQYQQSSTVFVHTINVEAGSTYRFKAVDTYGDGWNSGNFKVELQDLNSTSGYNQVIAETGLHVKFKRIGLNDCFAEGGSRDYLFDKYGLGARHIMQAVHALKREHNG